MMTATQKWIYGLVSTLVNGVASGVVLIIVSPETFNFSEGWRKLLAASAALGLMGMANYLKSSPLPKWDEETNTMSKGGFLIVASLTGALALSGCGGKPVTLVAQAGQGLSGAIVQAQHATKALTDGAVLSPAQALVVQRRLGAAADAMVPLPDLLLAIDAAAQAGQSDEARITAALAILHAVGVQLDDVIGGLPVGETAGQVLKAVSEARKLHGQIVDALAKRHSAEALRLLNPSLAN